jgi:glycosyltransferase involved in cell wall biosynthesis
LIPQISIVTPSYNQASFIEEALLSVKDQNYPSLEHIVVDGASTDGTVSILREYSAKREWQHLRWISEPDRGQADAINKGFALASGDIFAYICADDTYLPGTFLAVANYFEEHPETDLIYGSCLFTDDRGTPLRFKRAVPFDARKLLRRNLIWQPTVFFRAGVWKRTGTFNEHLHYAMDYEYWLRASKTCRIAVVDRPLGTYRWQMGSKTVSREHDLLREAYEVACKHGGGGWLSWYLHRLYWPNTSRLKRWLFSRFRSTALFCNLPARQQQSLPGPPL